LLLGGCLAPVRQDVDAVVCELAAHPLDLQTAPTPDRRQPMPTAQAADPLVQQTAFEQAPSGAGTPAPAQTPKSGPGKESIPSQSKQSEGPEKKLPGAEGGKAVSGPTREKLAQRLELPPTLPGATAPFQIPPRTATPEERAEAYRQLFPKLPALEPAPRAAPGPYGHPLTLTELQQIAIATNPTIRETVAMVKAMEGAARQAGAYPNPNFGYESDTAGTGATPGFQGLFIEQIIKTAGKLKLAQASALIDLLNAQLALRAARSTVASQVRTAYFTMLVARQTISWATDLSEFTERIYGIYLSQAVTGGLLGTYEPLQLRALAFQARAYREQAVTLYRSAWEQLAAALGVPTMPLTEVAGSPELPLPVFKRDELLARILSTHTDVLTARNSLQQARYNLRTAEVTPYPDLDFRLAVQKDFSMAPFLITHSVQLGMPIPIWDQNRGAIQQAQANLLRANEEEHRVRDDLTTRLADAFQRYEANRLQAEYYRERILPDLARTYSRVLLRYLNAPGAIVNPNVPATTGTPALTDIVTSQQLYVTAVQTYATALQAVLQAYSDVAGLLQTDNIFQMIDGACPVPDLMNLPVLPCAHPCDPLLNAAPDHDAVSPTEMLPQPRSESTEAKPHGSSRRLTERSTSSVTPMW
jgi:cobalt-zinc-cadmium efflux system outer membrane protein